MPASQKDDLLRFGTWNVRSLKGKDVEVIAEMKKYKLEMVEKSIISACCRQNISIYRYSWGK